MNNILLLSFVFSIVFVFTGCQQLGEQIIMTKSLSFEDVKDINIEASSADVAIIKENRDDIYIEFGTYEKGDILRTTEGKKTTIEIYNKNKVSMNFDTNYWLNIYVPDAFNQNLSINLSSGSVKLTDFNLNNIKCHFSSGDIHFDQVIAHDIDLELSSGNVVFNDVTTDLLTTDMSSGDVNLKDFTGKIKGDSSSGRFSVSYKDNMDDLAFEASSGRIKVDYSNVVVDGTFNLSKSSGDIDYDLDLTSSKDGDHLHGTIGSGKYNVDLDISSGDILIIN